MIRLITIISLLLWSLIVQSQTYFNQYWDFAGNSVATGKVVEAQNHFLVFSIISGEPPRFVVQKFSKTGQLLNTRTLVEGNVIGWEHGGNAIPLEDGSFLVAIKENQDVGGSEVILLIIDEDSNILDSARFAGPAYLSFEVIRQISQTADGGFLITGSSVATDASGNYLDDAGVIVIKTDGQLNLEWQRLYDKPQYAEGVQIFLNWSHIEMPNGNFLLGCRSCDYFVPGTCYNGTSVLVLLEISDEEGEIVNESTIEGYDNVHAPYLVHLDEQHFLLAHIGPDTDQLQESGKYWIYKKYKYSGELVWEQEYTNEGDVYYWNRSEIYTWPVVRSDKSYLQLFAFDDWIVGQSGAPNQWGTKSAIAVFDSLGNWMQTKVIERDTSLRVLEIMYDFEKTLDGGYILAGRRRRPQVPPVATQGWLVKLDSSLQLCTGWPCDSIAEFAVSNVERTVEIPKQQVTVFPNPASSLITFWFESPTEYKQSLLLMGSDGTVLLRQQLLPGEKQVTVQIQSLIAGLCFWELQQDGNPVSRGKIVIER